MGNLRRAFAMTGGVSDLSNPDLWTDWGISRKTDSGEVVTHESSLGLTAYFAALRNISEDLAKLPYNLYKRRPTRGQDIQHEHPVQLLMRRKPNPLMTAVNFRRTMTHRCLGWGYSPAEIVRDRSGVPQEIWPIHPSRARAVWDTSSTVKWEIHNPDGSVTEMRPRDLLVIQGIGDGVTGYSLLRIGADAIGLGLAAQRNAARLYGDGMARRVVASTKEELSPEGIEAARKRIAGDSDEGRRKIPFIPGDIDIHDVGINPDDAQALESREFTVEEIGRLVRMALAKMQYHKRAQGWSTLEALNTDYVVDTLMTWAVVWEEESWDKLLLPDEKDDHYFKHVFQAMLRGDYKTRVDGYAKMRQIGALSANDVRELEDQNPVLTPDGDEDPAGDVYHIQGAMIPMVAPADEEDEPEPEPEDAPEPPPEPAEDDEPENEDDLQMRLEALASVAEDAARRIVLRDIQRIESAVKRHASNQAAFDTWASGYVKGRAKTIDATFTPLWTAMWAVAARPATDQPQIDDALNPSDLISKHSQDATLWVNQLGNLAFNTYAAALAAQEITDAA